MTPGISAAIVGAEIGPLIAEIDARWLMAYAAGLGERDARYFETRSLEGPMAHPLFPVCYEWPVALALRAKTIADELAPLSVHATHHLRIARAPRDGDTLSTTARVIGVLRRRSGTLVTSRFTTVDARGATVSVTDYGSVYRGVATDADVVAADADVVAADADVVAADADVVAADADVADAGGAAAPDADAGRDVSREAGHHEGGSGTWSEDVDIAREAAHVYTECARIWNPIHTDVAVARAAGLPDIILHGTATLALAVSRVVTHELGGDARRVREIAGRFTGMVAMPSRLTVRGCATAAGGALAFDAVDPRGERVLSGGWIRA